MEKGNGWGEGEWWYLIRKTSGAGIGRVASGCGWQKDGKRPDMLKIQCLEQSLTMTREITKQDCLKMVAR